MSSKSSIHDHAGLLLRRLRLWFDEICRVYVDLYLDKEVSKCFRKCLCRNAYLENAHVRWKEFKRNLNNMLLIVF